MSAATALPRRAIIAVGIGQCACWGVLYYGYSVLLVPMQATLAAPRVRIAGAYSLGLLLMALLAPAVGRGFDLGLGKHIMRLGTALALLALILTARASDLPTLYLAWAIAGAAMAAVLYESAFALLQRAIAEPAARLRAIASVTVVGGLASTVFLPALGWVVDYGGWRSAALMGAVAILVAAWLMERAVFPYAENRHAAQRIEKPVATGSAAGLGALIAVFAGSTVASMGVVSLLIPHLHERGASIAESATVLGAYGVMQLPGRIWILRGHAMPSAWTLTGVPLIVQALGLGMIALSPWLTLSAVGVGLYGFGAGLHTLARPWLVQHRYGAQSGWRNGQVARAQGLGRAFAPVALIAAAEATSTTTALLCLMACLLAMLPLARHIVRTSTDKGSIEDHDSDYATR